MKDLEKRVLATKVGINTENKQKVTVKITNLQDYPQWNKTGFHPD
jgi:hypothetical protein